MKLSIHSESGAAVASFIDDLWWSTPNVEKPESRPNTRCLSDKRNGIRHFYTPVAMPALATACPKMSDGVVDCLRV
jgi:hypothetical protein